MLDKRSFQRDRTAEFKKYVQTHQELTGKTTIHVRPNSHRTQKSQFTQAALNVSSGITETTKLVTTLAKMVKSGTAVFDSGDQEITMITTAVTEQINCLKHDLTILDSSKSEAATGHQATHTTRVVHDLRCNVKSVTKTFEQALTETIRKKTQAHERNKEIGFGDSDRRRRRKRRQKRDLNKYILDDKQRQIPEIEPLIMPQQDQLTEQRQSLYYEDRLTDVQKIEQMLREVQSIFTQFNTILADQDHTINSLEEATETFSANTENTLVTLGDMRDGLQSNKWLVLRIMGILIFFAIFFTIFVL